jgi:hypothetical protein
MSMAPSYGKRELVSGRGTTTIDTSDLETVFERTNEERAFVITRTEQTFGRPIKPAQLRGRINPATLYFPLLYAGPARGVFDEKA